MTQTKPNRTRNDSANRQEINNKDSGDQHILPEFEQENAPHRPHRLSREDMDKAPPTDKVRNNQPGRQGTEGQK